MHPALFDNSAEFFKNEGTDHSLSAGSVTAHSKLPEEFRGLLLAAIAIDKEAKRELAVMGCKTDSEKVNRYYDCNYSGYDNNPDITACGRLGAREYVPCAKRGACSSENKLCKIPLGLTIKERDVVVCIVQGMLDKEIAHKLSISENTVRFHKDNAFRKMSVSTKPEAVAVAIRYHII